MNTLTDKKMIQQRFESSSSFWTFTHLASMGSTAVQLIKNTLLLIIEGPVAKEKEKEKVKEKEKEKRYNFNN